MKKIIITLLLTAGINCIGMDETPAPAPSLDPESLQASQPAPSPSCTDALKTNCCIPLAALLGASMNCCSEGIDCLSGVLASTNRCCSGALQMVSNLFSCCGTMFSTTDRCIRQCRSGECLQCCIPRCNYCHDTCNAINGCFDCTKEAFKCLNTATGCLIDSAKSTGSCTAQLVKKVCRCGRSSNNA